MNAGGEAHWSSQAYTRHVKEARADIPAHHLGGSAARVLMHVRGSRQKRGVCRAAEWCLAYSPELCCVANPYVITGGSSGCAGELGPHKTPRRKTTPTLLHQICDKSKPDTRRRLLFFSRVLLSNVSQDEAVDLPMIPARATLHS